MKRMYFAASSSENGRHYAHVIAISDQNNFLALLKHFKNLKVCIPCATKKRADEITSFWNDSYKKNGTFEFINL